MGKPSRFSAFVGAVGICSAIIWMFTKIVLSNPPEGTWTSMGLDPVQWARLRAVSALLAFGALDLLILANFSKFERFFTHCFVTFISRPKEVLAGAALVYFCLHMNASNAPAMNTLAAISTSFNLAPEIGQQVQQAQAQAQADETANTNRPAPVIGKTVVGTSSEFSTFARSPDALGAKKSIEQLMYEEHMVEVQKKINANKGKIKRETFQ